MTVRLLAAAVACGLLFLPAAARAAEADPLGEWSNTDGSGKIRIERCGDALCGTLVWARPADKQSRVGKRVLFDLKPTAPNTWMGKAYNPDDDKYYSGKMTLYDGTLTTSGCVLGGVACTSYEWKR